jgi:hypothetical protein
MAVNIEKKVANKNVLGACFDTVDFTGEWLASFGRPELHGSWIIWGGSSVGKTTFTLMLAKYLSKFKSVVYNSIEQGLSGSLQLAWKRVGMQEAGNNIGLLKKELLPELKIRLRRRRSPDIVIIDSVMCLPNFTRKEYMKLIDEFPNKLFIFLAHENNRKPDPIVGETIRRLSDVKIYVKGFVADVMSRFENPELGEGGKPFVIWEKGATEYRAKEAEKLSKTSKK